MTSAFLAIRDLTLRVGDFTLGPVSLELERRDYLVLMGASGCGKTTFLRTIAGLYPRHTGRIACNGRELTGLPPQKRRVGYVSQGASLFPHMTVRQNVRFGLDYCRISEEEKRERFDRTTALIGIGELLDRYPSTLSGGESKRVALARCLVVNPEVLLLDEPLSMLDPKARFQLLETLRKIHDAIDAVTIHVTHEAGELWTQRGSVAVMREGRILQVGDPETLVRSPGSEYVRDFLRPYPFATPYGPDADRGDSPGGKVL